ncbi:Peroxiredoxin [Caldicellulosiruptor obsidiansis OB47]|uniref:Peroxiredoxin n=1 Tax=Caldicellulosiruptor obsidiansis (strain ATCC BAA-2073 / JCM 16842 / OB47) TaxID=608506 RepID=D9TGQ8_CALOO|nr:peroxiredoxin [Caldicellulosiruptor obsidiansis]ADL41394.1 Peroxiredoxin [Caldicellulosiruptor obsidiansis OB47]
MEITNRIPLLGEKFPSMTVKTTHGMIKLPDDYAGKWFVLFSHPGDFTPVCTTEFVAFAKKADEFKKLNAELIGLSVDQVFAHIKWIEWIEEKLGVKIPFPVIADELGTVAKTLGMIHEAKGSNTVRAVFIVDDKGILRLMMYYPQEVGRSIDEILRALKALQVSTQNGVALPENWPNNSLIGDKVIIPPAATEDLAKERLQKAKDGEIECFDWWFCYKKL